MENADKYNKHVSPQEYRYEIYLSDSGEITAVRSDETLQIGKLESVFEVMGGREYVDDMGVRIDIPTMLEEITLPRTVGDELRQTSKEEVNESGIRERVMILTSALTVSLNNGFERRGGNNPL